MPKAIGLISGGLDSVLAARVLMDQGIQLLGLSFETPFFGPDRARRAADQLNIPLEVQEISRAHLEIVIHPPHGYGRAMNPCIDCHALMIRKAGELMQAGGYDFVFTGEVLNERPMSQNRGSLRLVADLSGYPDLLLRPLSARLLPETGMERSRMVDRTKLLDLQGRSRRRQLALAQGYGLTEYAPPAGGCPLTERGFSVKLKELLESENFDLWDVRLLRIGRHFRVQGVKVVVGRNEPENQRIKGMAREGDVLLSAEHLPGPVALVCGEASNEVLYQAAGICMAFSDTGSGADIPEVIGNFGHGKEERIRPPRLGRHQVMAFKIS